MSDKFSKFRNPNRFRCVTERIIGCPRFFKYAQTMCGLSRHTKANHGAVIVRGGRVISMGFNSTDQRREMDYNYTHAEMHAILRARSDVSGAKIYVFRQDRYGFISNSKPCNRCYEILKEHGIRRAIYTME